MALSLPVARDVDGLNSATRAAARLASCPQLHRGEDALGHGMVPTPAAPPHAADDAFRGEHVLIVAARVSPIVFSRDMESKED